MDRKEELLITIDSSLEFIGNDIDELLTLSNPLEKLVFQYMKDQVSRITDDYKNVAKGIRQSKNEDLSND